MERIGRIRRIRRYPVKSMMGEDLTAAILESYGMVGDRIYAFTDDLNHNPRFPWMTARNASEMLLYRPSFLSEKEIVVELPNGRKYSITDPALEKYFEEKFSLQMTLKHRESGCHDSKPVSIISSRTIRSLGAETGIELAGERFRANIYADWDNQKPFYEDELLGKRIKIGNGASLKIVKKDSRCIIPTVDPYTSVASPIILQAIKENHGGCIGVYADVEKPGPISLGDEIFLL